MGMEKAFKREFLVDGLMQAPTGIAIFSVPDFIITAANPFYRRIVNRREEDLMGRPLLSAIPEIRKEVEPPLQQVLATGKPYFRNEIETDLIRQGKIEKTYLNLIYQPITNGGGSIGAIMVVATDVTGLVKAKHRLQESEEKFRLIVAQSPISMAILRGPEWVIELANESMLKNIWNRQLHQVMGKKLMDVFPELKDQPFPELLQKVFDTGKKYSDKEMAVYIEGAACNYIDFEYSPLFEPDNSVSGIIVTAYDVSEKVKERRKTQENEARLRMVIEASGLGTWELNIPTGDFTYSEEYLATFGASRKLSNEELLSFMHPDDKPAREQAFQEAFATGWLHHVARLRWKDNTIHWMEVQGKVLYDDQQQPARIIGTSRDVTDERIHQQSIRESEEKFRLLADSMPQFIWTGDVNGNLNYFNQSVYDYTGLTFEEMKGQGWIQIIHPDDRTANVKKWREAIKNGGHFLFEHRFRRADGVYRWQLSRAIPQYDSHGDIQMWVGSSTDIHDQKTFAKDLEEKVLERTKELKETNEVLEKTNRELEQFAYIASHDLQEPLRKIQTFSDMLKRNINDEVSARKYFSKINSSAKRMGDLIKSVLDYSRLPAHPGQLMLTDLNEIFGNVKTDLELLILEKGAIVESDTLPAVPGMPLQLHQLFSNLIGNGLKFCRKEPFIRIAARALFGEELTGLFKADPHKRYLELTFNDNGIGFENKYKDQIFTIFQRLHGLQQYSGTGIGLALCKKIVENHHGYITAESQLGKGSTFTVYLPS
jgi:PAS domain S-box-containing protein